MKREENLMIKKKTENKSATAAASSIIGTRKEQQDFGGLVEDSSRTLAVICDGMGGLAGGSKASRCAVELLISDYEKNNPQGNYADFLCREAALMDKAVYNLKDEQGNPLHAGCTLVAVILNQGGLDWVSVGDSHIYIIRDEAMIAVTRDHNYRRELEDALEQNVISREYYTAELQTKRADALTNYIGMGGIRRMERTLRPFPLLNNDMILLCSDGLYKRLDDDQIKALALDNKNHPQVAVNRMNRMVMQKTVRSQDNTTIVLIQYQDSQEEE